MSRSGRCTHRHPRGKEQLACRCRFLLLPDRVFVAQSSSDRSHRTLDSASERKEALRACAQTRSQGSGASRANNHPLRGWPVEAATAGSTGCAASLFTANGGYAASNWTLSTGSWDLTSIRHSQDPPEGLSERWFLHLVIFWSRNFRLTFCEITVRVRSGGFGLAGMSSQPTTRGSSRLSPVISACPEPAEGCSLPRTERPRACEGESNVW